MVSASHTKKADSPLTLPPAVFTFAGSEVLKNPWLSVPRSHGVCLYLDLDRLVLTRFSPALKRP